MRLTVDGEAVCVVDWIKDEVISALEEDASAPEDVVLLDELMAQLDEYFRCVRRSFDLSLRTSGTEFQEAVWSELQKIPYSTTGSYSEIARRIGRPTAVRAVGHAIHCNPIGILIPCHRVIGADGSLTGYGGGLDIKGYLLRLEGIL